MVVQNSCYTSSPGSLPRRTQLLLRKHLTSWDFTNLPRINKANNELKKIHRVCQGNLSAIVFVHPRGCTRRTSVTPHPVSYNTRYWRGVLFVCIPGMHVFLSRYWNGFDEGSSRNNNNSISITKYFEVYFNLIASEYSVCWRWFCFACRTALIFFANCFFFSSYHETVPYVPGIWHALDFDDGLM